MMFKTQSPFDGALISYFLQAFNPPERPTKLGRQKYTGWLKKKCNLIFKKMQVARET